MIHIDFNPMAGFQDPDDQKFWDDWASRAQEALDRLLLKWRNNERITSTDFDQRIWSDLKKWLKTKVFHNKCAYCEIELVRDPGDAEHFRPKGEVRYLAEGKKRSDKAHARSANGEMTEHPGYFWLAYDWRNLVPTCNYCNRAIKRNLFPVNKTHVYVIELSAAEVMQLHELPMAFAPNTKRYLLRSTDLDTYEGCILLHPYWAQPSMHIRFGEGGTVVALDDRGEQSIHAYKLDDSDLERKRQQAQMRARRRFNLAFEYANEVEQMTHDQAVRHAWEKMADWKNGVVEFSAAGCDYLRYVEHKPEPP